MAKNQTTDDDLLGDEAPAGVGHNRVGNIAADQLRSIIERIENLQQEKQALQGDISDIFAEAKGNGFDCRTIREILKIRKKDASTRQEEEALLDTYKAALGMALLD